MFASAVGLGLGCVAGLSIGPHLWKRVKTPDYSHLSEAADHDDQKPAPAHGLNVQADMRRLLEACPPWLQDPGYQQVAMINRLLQILWPHITTGVLKMVLREDMFETVLQPQLKKQLFDKFAFIEDIVLGSDLSLKHGTKGPDGQPLSWGDFSKFITGDKRFSLGSRAPKLEGIKFVPTTEDELILELTAVWGSDLQLDVSALLKFGALRLYVPLHLSNVSFRADLRVTVKPLVEEIPVVGGVTVSLLKVPTVDCCLRLIKGVDLMALPFLPQLLNMGLKFVLEPMMPLVPGLGLIYPNGASFPIMKNWGIKPPPLGALEVTVMQVHSLHGASHPYVALEVRQGRVKRTQASNKDRETHAYEFSEQFSMIVDNLQQALTLNVFNDDFGADTHMAVAVLPFATELVSTDPATGQEVLTYEKADWFKEVGGVKMDIRAFKPKAKASAVGASIRMVASMGKAPGALTRLFTRKSKSKSANLDTASSLPAPAGALEASTSADTALSTKASAPPGDAQECVAVVRVHVKFLPFLEPKYDDEEAERAAAAASKKKDPRVSLFPPPASQSLLRQAAKGVLTVQLVQCINMAPEGSKDLAIYVRLHLASDEVDETQLSTTIFNETSPRWGDKFDFVLIPASGSELYLEVFNRASGVLSGVTSVLTMRKKNKEDTGDQSMGKLLIPVSEVVRNGMLRDQWALQDTDRGAIELKLTWQPCFLQDS